MSTETEWYRWGTRARKFAVALVGAAATIVATGLVPEDITIYVNAGIGLLTALGVYQVPNVD